MAKNRVSLRERAQRIGIRPAELYLLIHVFPDSEDTFLSQREECRRLVPQLLRFLLCVRPSSLRRLAYDLGVSSTYLSMVLRNKTKPSTDLMRTLASIADRRAAEPVQGMKE
jgi:hypothetical protein